MNFPVNNIMYLYRKEFGDYEPILAAIANGEEPIGMLADVLTEVTGDTWALSQGDFSVKDAKVEYFGDNKRLFPTSSRYRKVMVVEISKEASTKMNGRIYLQMFHKTKYKAQ